MKHCRCECIHWFSYGDNDCEQSHNPDVFGDMASCPDYTPSYGAKLEEWAARRPKWGTVAIDHELGVIKVIPITPGYDFEEYKEDIFEWAMSMPEKER